MFKNVKNMALSAKKWLSQPKRFPTPGLDNRILSTQSVNVMERKKYHGRSSRPQKVLVMGP